MRILVEIGHPAHVHFFKGAILNLRKNGHFVRILTRDKEITNALLDRLGFEYECLSRPATGGKHELLLELMKRWKDIIKMIHKDKIEKVVSISGISTSFPAWTCRVPNIVFTDTEDAKISNWIAFPFASKIFTPNFFLGDLGPKHARYAGLHEMAYLQDFDFEAAKKTRVALGFPEKYSIIRTVANDALHDQDIHGLSTEHLQRMVDYLSRAGAVFITSQGPIPEAFASYRLTAPIEHAHAIMAGAQLFIGESPTMAVESSLLGTPAFLISGRVHRLGNMVGLEKDFELLRNFTSWEEAEKHLPNPENFVPFKNEWSQRASEYRHKTANVSEFVERSILGEPS